MVRSFVLFVALLQVTLFNVAGADTGAPICPGWTGQPIGIINSEILHWKRTTQNQFRDRGHVYGDIVQVYPDANGHDHFSIQIGPNEGDTVEVIYNQDFGTVPTPQVGQHVEACGDYITSTAQSAQYPASPDGALVHWVHRSPNEQKHPDGFLMIDGTLYGQDTQDAGPRH